MESRGGWLDQQQEKQTADYIQEQEEMERG